MDTSSFSLPTARASGLTSDSRRRRDRLADVSRDVDESFWDERRRAMRALLSRPLLVESGSARTLVNRHREWLELWFSHYPGWELRCDADAARLVKRPAQLDDDSRPCRDPGGKGESLSRRGYVFLCLILSILVREGRQITLKNIAEPLAGMGKADPLFAENGVALDLDYRATRRDLVQALRVLLDWRVLVRVVGNEDGFVAKQEVDVLYNIDRPLLSRLHASRQSPSLVAETDFEKRLQAIAYGPARSLLDEPGDEVRRRDIRFGLYRRLLDDPVLYYDDLAADERDYLDKQRTFICREIERATGLIAEVRAEGIAMVDLIGDLSDYSLPETGTDGHLALLLATSLAERLKSTGGGTRVTLAEIEMQVRGFAQENKTWRKDARAPGAEGPLARETISRLRALGLVLVIDDPVSAVIPLPAIGRFGIREAEPASDAKEAGELELF